MSQTTYSVSGSASLPQGTDGQLLVGQTGLAPAYETVGTDATLAKTGALTIANNAVTAAKIANGTITTTQISNSAGIVGGQIANTTITDGNVAAATLTGAKMLPKAGYFSVTTATNTTNPVNVFGAGGAPCALTITGVLSIAKDTTASNITVQQAGNTVCTIAKGTVSGGVVGAASLANATYAASDVCTVLSSGAGNSFVVITFTTA